MINQNQEQNKISDPTYKMSSESIELSFHDNWIVDKISQKSFQDDHSFKIEVQNINKNNTEYNENIQNQQIQQNDQQNCIDLDLDADISFNKNNRNQQLPMDDYQISCIEENSKDLQKSDIDISIFSKINEFRQNDNQYYVNKYRQIKHENDQINASSIGFIIKDISINKKNDPSFQLITFEDAWQKCLQLNLEQPQIKKQYNNFSCFCISQKQKTPKIFMKQKDQIFSLAKLQIEQNIEVIDQILWTIWTLLKENYDLNFERYGEHWISIGFNGNDPQEDLKKVGLLGLLQILFLIDNDFNLIVKLQQLKDIPICISLLRFTDLCLRTLKAGQLFQFTSDQTQLIDVLNNLYLSLVQKFCTLFYQQKLDKSQYTTIFNQIEELLKKDIKKFIC